MSWFDILKIEETEIDGAESRYRTTVRLKNADGSELRCKVCHRNKWNRTPDDDYKKYMCKNCGYGAIDRPKSKSQIRRDNSRTPSKKQKNREKREARRKKRAARRKDRW
tara:strand:- start:95 stop:421 length:327 start_codon:yes stop_codon:yes gene_type:complete